MMKGFVRHHQLGQALEENVIGVGVHAGEGAHGQPFHQHLHADDFLVDHRRRDKLAKKIAEGLADRIGGAPTDLDVAPEGGDMAGLFASLIGGIFLGTGIDQDVAQAGAQTQGALLPVQEVGDHPAGDLVRQADALTFVELVGDRRVELGDTIRRHQEFAVEVEGCREIDVGIIHRVPEVVVGLGNDVVEGVCSAPIAIDFDHRREIVRGNGAVYWIAGQVFVHASAPLATAGAGSWCPIPGPGAMIP